MSPNQVTNRGNLSINGEATAWPNYHDTITLEDAAIKQQLSSSLYPGTEQIERVPSTLDASRQRLGDLSRNGSEADSLLELYRQQRAGMPSTHKNSANSEIRPRTLEEEEAERERWIHRDKLAVIESQEARAAGIKIPREFDVNPEDVVPNGQEYTGYSENYNRVAHGDHDERRQKLRSPSPDRGETTEPLNHFHDPRTPEEIAADLIEAPSSSPMYSQHALRSSSSRIPLATSSPLPISQQHLERNTPLLRKRGTSGNWEEDGMMYNKSRSRSHSIGSQVLLHDPDLSNDTVASSPYGVSGSSPSRAKAPSKAQPVSATKRSANNSQNASTAQKLRSTSATSRGSPAQRPGTRSGPDGRPPTAVNRPEGDPPWLATMYKPDPRLPPDQQIIPTLAKRLQQEKWEKEGKAASAFDRDFTPLAISTSEPPSFSGQTSGPSVPDAREDTAAWPLKSTLSGSPKPAHISVSGSDHAGYSTTPKLQNTPPLGQAQKPAFPQRMEVQQSLRHEQEKDTGCGCCLVM